MPEIIFTPEAESDIAAAQDWYMSQQDGLDASFLEKLAITVSNIRQRPESFAPIKLTVRRASLDRFPYYVAYEVESPELIVVLRVLHNKQDRSTKL